MLTKTKNISTCCLLLLSANTVHAQTSGFTTRSDDDDKQAVSVLQPADTLFAWPGADDDGYAPLNLRGDLYQWYLQQTTGDPLPLGVDPVEGGLEDDDVSGWGLVDSSNLFSRSGREGPDDLVNDGPHFEVAEFENHLLASMDDQAVGYSYAINFNKQLYNADAEGMARMPQDYSGGPLVQVPQSATRRMNIASISKNLTAVAVLQLLEKNGLSVDAPISPWLPAAWDKGYGMVNGQAVTITFYDLLTHRSGFKQTIVALEAFDEDFAALNKMKWDGLEAMVNYGIIPTYHGDYDYSNVNYALFRAIIPALWRASGERDGIDENLTAETAAAWYSTYMAENLFIPLGIHQAACKESDNENARTLFYNVYEPTENGVEGGDWSLLGGSSGWVLSAHNLAKLMAHIRYNNDILSPAMRSQMDDLRLGWRAYGGERGTYLGHGGALYFDDLPFSERREMQGCIMKFPIQVEAVLLVNSSIVDDVSPCAKLRDAYDAAWVD